MNKQTEWSQSACSLGIFPVLAQPDPYYFPKGSIFPNFDTYRFYRGQGSSQRMQTPYAWFPLCILPCPLSILPSLRSISSSSLPLWDSWTFDHFLLYIFRIRDLKFDLIQLSCRNRALRHTGPSHGWLYSVQDTAWKSSLLCSSPWTRPPSKVDSQLHHYQLSSNSSDGCMDMLVNINDHSRDSYNLKNIVELPGEDYLCLTGIFLVS